ncbi:hypothetical protein GCM10009760_56280 [Kitasatospora kazusensis]|uniref:Uncharacterized protein n=1 Tax=Kitasatospora kazusensis TaxID=407974 RepID=A0ABP5M0V8_9ACTN
MRRRGPRVTPQHNWASMTGRGLIVSSRILRVGVSATGAASHKTDFGAEDRFPAMLPRGFDLFVHLLIDWAARRAQWMFTS